MPEPDHDPQLADDLESGRMHLWLLQTDRADERAAAAWRTILIADEHARNDRFVDPGAQLSHLAGRALLRSVLSRYAPGAPRDWRILTSTHGRPFVAPEQVGWDLRFNLSHARGLVALVVASGCDVGVDVERADREVDVEELAPLVLAFEEAAALACAPAERRKKLFMEAWTLKEAYLKARGVGLSEPMTSCAFDLAALHGEEAFSALRPDAGSGWRFAQLRPTPDHILAIARHGPWRGLQVERPGA